MLCPRCQAENRAGVHFCEACGSRIASTCATCGSELVADKRFCGSCGSRVATAPAARSASPQAYTPAHLAERILISRTSLEGERKQVTVLFADLKGSMELLADRDPEEARKLIDPLLERMMEAVHRYDGVVNQVLGDGIMALFGAPLAQEEHAVRACCAALRMQASVRRYAEEVFRSHGLPIQIRVGLNSGEVVVGAIDSDLHMDYTAVGQTTHLAARMEQMATPGTILLTAATLELAEGYVQVKPLGPVPVKGLGGSMEVYELVAADAVRSRLRVAAARGLTRFVGRDQELDDLRHALERTGTGHGQVVAVVGEAGVGKSRLYWEFTRSHRTHGWLILDSGSVSYGKATSYLPVIGLLKGYFQIEGRDDAPKVREKVTDKLLLLDRALESALPALLSLLEVQNEDAQWERLGPPGRRQRIHAGVKSLLLRESQVQPLIVIFEDLHWIDGESQALLGSLVESIPAARVLLLVNYRPDYQHDWGRKSYYSQLQINPLPARTSEDLLTGLLGPDASLEPLKRQLIERTEGNPLFLEESVRALVETKALVGERSAYRLAGGVQTAQVPPTVQAILAARIDRLSSDDKRLLQAASVIGKDVPLSLLQAIVDLSAEALREALTRLQGAEFVYETGRSLDLEYTFKHALTQEVAYGGLLHEQRRGLHSRIAEAIETLYSDHRVEHIERLAQHAFRGGVWKKAVGYLRQAGLKAFAHSAHREAVAWFERALEALEHLPRTRDAVEQAIDLRFDLRNSLLPLGEHERYFGYLREAEALARDLDDQPRLGLVAAYICAHLYLMGDQEHALESGQRALTIADALGDSKVRVPVTAWIGQAYYYRGDYRRAASFFQQNVDGLVGDLMMERFGLPQLPSVHSRTCLVWCLSELGEFADGIRIGDQALEIARGVDHPVTLMIAYAGLGMLWTRRGDSEQAIALLEPALELCRSWDVRLWFTRIASALGSAYGLGGRFAEALPLLRQAVGHGESIGLIGGHSHVLGCQAEALLVAGHAHEAHEVAQRAFDLSQQYKERGYQAWALRLLADAALHGRVPSIDDAVRDARHALEIADELEMRPLVARAHLVLGQSYRLAGQHTASKEHLAEATRLFHAMDMRLWAERSESEQGALA
jgi:class 3 adenylate cyclase/tetratricopeptide (TPR) repeat protein